MVRGNVLKRRVLMYVFPEQVSRPRQRSELRLHPGVDGLTQQVAECVLIVR